MMRDWISQVKLREAILIYENWKVKSKQQKQSMKQLNDC